MGAAATLTFEITPRILRAPRSGGRRRERRFPITTAWIDVRDESQRLLGRIEITKEFGGLGPGRPTVLLRRTDADETVNSHR